MSAQTATLDTNPTAVAATAVRPTPGASAPLPYRNAVIFGAGQVGLTLADQLTARGASVTLVNRRGQAGEPLPAGATIVVGDLTDPATVIQLAQHADVVFETAQPAYTAWPQQFPPLLRSILTGLAQTNARLVFVDNLYMYGPTHGRPIREDLPYAATGPKGTTRAEVANLVLDAHRSGQVQATIGRASDFYGPRATDTAVFGDRFFAAALAGKPVDLFGNPDLPHTYTYVPDFARALITLSAEDAAYGRAWHVPNAETVSTRELLHKFEAALGRPIKSRVAGPLLLSLVGLFVPIVREMKEMAYEFDEAYIVDDAAFRQAFGAQTSPLDEAVRATVAWHMAQQRAQHAAQPATQHATVAKPA